MTETDEREPPSHLAARIPGAALIFPRGCVASDDADRLDWIHKLETSDNRGLVAASRS